MASSQEMAPQEWPDEEPVDLLTMEHELPNVQFHLKSSHVNLDKQGWKWVKYALGKHIKTRGLPAPQYEVLSDDSAIDVSCSVPLKSQVVDAFTELEHFFGCLLNLGAQSAMASFISLCLKMHSNAGAPCQKPGHEQSKPCLYISATFPEKFWLFKCKGNWACHDNDVPANWDIKSVMSPDELVRHNRHNPEVLMAYADDDMSMIIGASTDIVLDEAKARLGNIATMKQIAGSGAISRMTKHHLNAEGYTELDAYEESLRKQGLTQDPGKAAFYAEIRYLSNIQPDLPKTTFLDEKWKPKTGKSISYKSMYESGVSIRICKKDKTKGFHVSLLGPEIGRPSSDAGEPPSAPPKPTRYSKRQDLSWTPSDQAEETEVIPMAPWVRDLLQQRVDPETLAPSPARQSFAEAVLSRMQKHDAQRPQQQQQQRQPPDLLDDPIASRELDDIYPVLEDDGARLAHSDGGSTELAHSDAGTSEVHHGGNQQDLIDLGADDGSLFPAAPSLPFRVHQTMKQQAPSADLNRKPKTFPFPDDLQVDLKSLIALGPYVWGQESLRLDLGRVVMIAQDGAAVSFNSADVASNGYKCHDLLEKVLNYRVWGPDSYELTYHFTRILTTAPSDITAMMRAKDNGISLWEETSLEPSLVYSFHCRSLKDGMKTSQFIVDISDAGGDDTFSFTIRSPENPEESITIHHVCRNWDSQFRFAHSETSKLLDEFGQDAEMLLRGFWVRTVAPDAGFGFALKKEAKFNVLDVRAVTTWRVLSQDKHTALTVTGYRRFNVEQCEDPQAKEGPAGWTQFMCPFHTKKEMADIRLKFGQPTQWVEASITSTRLEDMMKKNENIGFYSKKADWKSEASSTIECLRDIWNQGTRMVRQMDSIGALNDNGQMNKFRAPRSNNQPGTQGPVFREPSGW